MQKAGSFYPSDIPWIMGILNVTPDSFSDGARYQRFDKAIAHAEDMLENGADIIDIGGESTRPGAAEVSVSEEIDRVVPLVERIAKLGARISVDTSKPEVMSAAIRAGAHMINDVRALSMPGALEVVANAKVPVCLMHMQGQPRTMQHDPKYASVVDDVISYLQNRVDACVLAGVPRELISIDPGFGFGKRLSHNLDLLKHLSRFKSLGATVLAGLSRKSMLGEITGQPVEDRLSASLSVALIAMQQGAKIIRVHDVEETNDVRKVFLALQESN